MLIHAVVILGDGIIVQRQIGNPIILSEFLKSKPADAANVAKPVYSKKTFATAFSDDTETFLSPKRVLKEPNNVFTGGSKSIQKAAPNPTVPPKSNSFVAGKEITPISSLRPRMFNWTIRVRVTNKTDIHTWSNAKGSGKLFSVDFVDESGEIRCTGFKSGVDKYYHLFEINKIYYVSKCQTKATKKGFSYLNHDYELSFTNQSIVKECLEVNEVRQVPKELYNFVPLEEVLDAEVGKVIGKKLIL